MSQMCLTPNWIRCLLVKLPHKQCYSSDALVKSISTVLETLNPGDINLSIHQVPSNLTLLWKHIGTTKTEPPRAKVINSPSFKSYIYIVMGANIPSKIYKLTMMSKCGEGLGDRFSGESRYSTSCLCAISCIELATKAAPSLLPLLQLAKLSQNSGFSIATLVDRHYYFQFNPSLGV
ncbi:hypothetical protein TWF970_008160 [Orbilia oligospora]|uniref:Uncharacterized protein n=1 Tax=Orbilia oligospora TaxID=2813651 RepID=A0A7C8R4C7_ORBOL|nr:hypothetical protein TWF970_008160 [Orbilia oligospora]